MNNYNENNQNQDLNARAATPGFSENLVDGGGSGTNAPAPFNIQMYNTNENGYKVTGDVLACDPNKTLFCKIIMTGETPFRTLTKATLKIRQSSGSAGDFAIQLSDENNTDYAQEKFNRTKQVVENGATYQVADIGYYLQNCENKTVYLAIKSQNGNYCSLYTNTSVYKPQIDVEYIDDDDFIPNVPTIENTVGSKGKYSINVRNGKLFYFQNIFTANGSRLPFNLSMTYNAADCDKNNPNVFQGTIKGWTFNYQQTLKKIDRDYIYLDGMHKYHRFTWAKNDIYIMPDVSACNGTILKSRNIPYEITDGKTTTLKFDQSNRLYEISVLRGSGSPICNTIAYDANGRLATVTDGEGDTYSFSYATDKITIYKGLVSDENKKALVEITIASTGTVSSVKNLLSQQIYTFTYTDENQLASVKDSASAQLTNFGYTSSGSIKSALSFVQKNEGQTRPVTGTFFTYKYRHTVVATAQNSANDSPATTRIGYFFDTNGELQHTAEWAVDQYKGLSHVNKTPFTTNIEQVQNATIHSFIFSDNGKGADTIDVQDFKLFLNPIQTPPDTLVLPTNQKYVFCGKACIENLDPQLETLTATLIAGNGNKLCTLEFDPNQKEFQFQSKSFDAYSGEAEYCVKLNVGKTQAHATVGDFKILLSSAPTVCTDQTVSGKKSHVERSSSGSKTWYEMKECTLYCDDEDYVENVAFTFKDYMLTKFSMLKNPESYNVWFNDGRDMFINIEHTFLSFYLQPSFQLANAKFALLQSAANKTTFTHIEPPEDQGTYLTNFFKIKTVVNGVTTEQQTTVPFAESEEEYDQFFRVKKSIDVNGIETTYYYDNIGNVTSVYTNPVGSNGVNVVRSFEYNSQGNLAAETNARTWETFRTSYTYNDDKVVSSVTTPASQTTNYSYTADNEKLQSISSTLAYPYYTATNNIVYSGDYVDSLTANDTTFRFTYDERNDVKSVSIRSTEDESVFNFESQSNFNDPWNASRTVTYGNGQKIRRYYDVYNRLIRVNDVTSTYKPLALYIYSAEELSKVESDEIKISNPNDYRLVRSSDAKLRRVIMPTSQSLAIVIDYTYDYSGQVTKTVEYNQAITTSDTNVAFNQSQQATSSLTVEQTQKDEYQRTTKTTATCNDITLVNSCTYESFVTDAVTQENTEVKSGNSTLGTVQTDYTTDALKRLQSVKVTVNGNGYSRDIAYIPRQTRTLIPGPGGGFEPVIKAKAAPIYKTETVGTTYYPSLVTTKELRNNSAVETESLSLTYDANGNITTYGYNTYTYDKFNRLTRENNYYLDKTITWEYDVGGNITSRKEYSLTTSSILFNPTKTDSYTYGGDWKDQLTSLRPCR